MNHTEALAYLDSLESLGIRPGLERIRALLARLGDPHRDFPSVLIAGTNGKGSVAAFVASILQEAGLMAGLYTSPHLVRFEERIAVAGEPIGAPELATLTGEVARAIAAVRAAGGDPPTYFEATTAIAFLHFSRRRVPLAVLEVGMGGRFDATNVVEPLACAITAVAMDHMRYLGDTLTAIAGQKAGILKPAVPAVIARQQAEAMEVIRSEARAVGAPLIETAACATEPPPGLGRFPDPPAFRLRTGAGALYDTLAVRLRGDHQIENATVAILLAGILASRWPGALDAAAIARGLRHAWWPGRIELLPGDPALLLDGAHNPAACRILADYLTTHQPGRSVVMVFAAMRDKSVDAMLRILGPLAREVVLAPLPGSRAATTAEMLRIAAGVGCRASQGAGPADALARARAIAGQGGLVVACGSLYLVGELKKILPPA